MSVLFFLNQDRQRVVGLSRGASPPPGYNNYLQMDLRDSYAVRSAIDRIKPDVVVNTAALASHSLCEREPDLALALNCDVAANNAAAARESASFLIHISTDAVFDGQRGHYSEGDSVSPFSVYGRTKLVGEEAVLRELPRSLIARTNFFWLESLG